MSMAALLILYHQYYLPSALFKQFLIIIYKIVPLQITLFSALFLFGNNKISGTQVDNHWCRMWVICTNVTTFWKKCGYWLICMKRKSVHALSFLHSLETMLINICIYILKKLKTLHSKVNAFWMQSTGTWNIIILTCIDVEWSSTGTAHWCQIGIYTKSRLKNPGTYGRNS